jgi:hypothetical protein
MQLLGEIGMASTKQGANSSERIPRIDEIVLGGWIETKSPSSIVLRRFLADFARCHYMAPEEYRGIRAKLIDLEAAAVKVREVIFPLMLPEGGVQ